MLPGAFDRSDALRRLADTRFDVVVVGGGITGVGCALDAASRGLRTALVERDDFASGTSSKSSKLVHGGLRYLQQGDIRLVYEALLERQRLRHNAPHLVKTLPFLIPIFGSRGVVNKKLARAMGSAMWMYDLTGGVRIGKLHKRISPREARAHFPVLPEERLLPSYLYYDARADDARLSLAVARTAALEFGAVVANRVEVSGLTKDDQDRVVAVEVEADGQTLTVRTDSVINATGVWADDIRALDDPTADATIRPAKGIHITVPWHRLRNDIAAVIPVPADKRSVFVVPWGDFSFVGTTDTDYDGPLDDPQCTPQDVQYLLDAVNGSTTAALTVDDVVATWAGLRPLVASASPGRTADLSRRHKVQRSPSGVVTITGGKLTTYREMAADTVDEVLEHVLEARVLERAQRHSRTRRLRLHGAAGYEELVEDADGVSPLGAEIVVHLADRHGGEARTVLAIAERDPDLARPLVDGLPYLRAEAVYAVRYEMARTLDDVLSRRTRARLLARDDSAAAAADVAALIAPELGWDAAETARQVERYRAAVADERRAPDLPEVALDAAVGA
ncbi:glycerol-3-phosphate dehydrogenase/oxidase [Rhabdothermincola salaria]|uniref:glycerol-3-phosphate dehydrogenase/oxidase n=1 Tax=Rhabdothermincola salaria TaxID=2903142 RepID=UPI001E62784C|nr:glycerol-3-phosphate dehydrogenase/oxidase [Rhabdothermincola salaria]MCD9622422.1 glycerol-3-phosphate dehydrogenase/oxidase [Rhabdothermincola salaria]